MADYPDNTRLFQLVGTDITIPINIEASDVTLPVSIESQAAVIEVEIRAASTMVWIGILESIVTVDVNIESQTAYIDFNFADQSVAVFDAAKWFAHQAEQVFLTGSASVPDNSGSVVVSRTVPAATTFYVAGLSFAVASNDAPNSTMALVLIDSAHTMRIGSIRGAGLSFDVPLRVLAGEKIELELHHFGSGSAAILGGNLWGYDEED